MGNKVQLGFRVEQEVKNHLDILCQETFRGQTDMVSYLIEQEWSRLHPSTVLEQVSGLQEEHSIPAL